MCLWVSVGVWVCGCMQGSDLQKRLTMEAEYFQLDDMVRQLRDDALVEVERCVASLFLSIFLCVYV